MFLFFPADGWTTDDLQYLWKTLDPVQIVKNLHLPRFRLEKYISDYCNIETNTGAEKQIITIIITWPSHCVRDIIPLKKSAT